MKKFVKVVALILVVAVMACAFAGCEKSLDKAVIGAWQSPNENNRTTIEFREDGTVTFDFGSITILGVKLNSAVDGTYKLDMEKEPAQITIVPQLPLANIGVNFTFTLDAVYDSENDMLTLENSDMNISLSMVRAENVTEAATAETAA